MTHAVARLRDQRLARSAKPFVARGSHVARCPRCRVMHSHCLCALRPQVATRSGMCLIMCDIEPVKPTNSGWLIADVVPDTFAFGWARTEVDPALLALLADPQWDYVCRCNKHSFSNLCKRNFDTRIWGRLERFIN